MLIMNTAQTATKKTGGFSYADWYQKNKQRLSEKKAKRYKEDEQYRNAALERSRANRKGPQVLDLGAHTVSFKEAAEQLGVTVWVLREWRRKDYFPEPKAFGNRLYFTVSQVGLLEQLKAFFAENGIRTSEEGKEPLVQLVGYIYANWQANS